VLHGIATQYLRRFVRIAGLPGRQALRSAGTNRLVVLPFKLSTIGARAYQVASLHIWNSLPANIMSALSLPIFHQGLKTHLYRPFPHLILYFIYSL